MSSSSHVCLDSLVPHPYLASLPDFSVLFAGVLWWSVFGALGDTGKCFEGCGEPVPRADGSQGEVHCEHEGCCRG